MARLESAIAVRSAALSPGRAPSFGSIEAKFGFPITSPRQLGLKTSARPGAETVKLINKFDADAIKIPQTEVKSDAVSFPEVVPARSEPGETSVRTDTPLTLLSKPKADVMGPTINAGPFIIRISAGIQEFDQQEQKVQIPKITEPEPVKLHEQISGQKDTSAIEQTAILSRLQSFLRTRGLSRLQPTQAAIAEPQTVSEPQVTNSPEAETLTLITPKTGLNIEPVQRNEIQTVVNRASDSLIKSRRQIVNFTQEKAVVDEKTNKFRVEALIRARDKLRLTHQEESREAIVKESGIIDSEGFKSRILIQAGLEKRKDGTQPRIGDRIISGQGLLTDREVEEVTQAETAVMRARDGIEVGDEQLEKVARPSREPYLSFDKEQILPKEKEVKVVEDSQVVARNKIEAPASLEIAKNPETTYEIVEVEEIAREVLGVNSNFVQSILDRGVNIIDQAKNALGAFIRRQQVFAE